MKRNILILLIILLISYFYFKNNILENKLLNSKNNIEFDYEDYSKDLNNPRKEALKEDIKPDNLQVIKNLSKENVNNNATNIVDDNKEIDSQIRSYIQKDEDSLISPNAICYTLFINCINRSLFFNYPSNEFPWSEEADRSEMECLTPKQNCLNDQYQELTYKEEAEITEYYQQQQSK